MDISSIADGSTITKSEFRYEGQTNPSTDNCYIYAIANQPSIQSDNDVGNQVIWDDAGDGTAYLNNDAVFPEVGQNKDVGGASGPAWDNNPKGDVETALGVGWFAIGIKSSEATSCDMGKIRSDDYIGPPVPLPTLYVEYTPGAPSNTAPTVDYKTPINGTTDVAYSGGVTCYAYTNDTDGDSLDVTWATNESGSWVNKYTNTSEVANGIESYTFTDFDTGGTTYWWKVYVNDSYNNISEIYHFTTAAAAREWQQISSGYFSFSNTSDSNIVSTGYFTFTATDRTGQLLSQGYFAFTNSTSKQLTLLGYFAFTASDRAKQLISQGFFTFSNTSVNQLIDSGYFTFGNITSTNIVSSGYFTFVSIDRIKQQISQGYFTFGNASQIERIIQRLFHIHFY